MPYNELQLKCKLFSKILTKSYEINIATCFVMTGFGLISWEMEWIKSFMGLFKKIKLKNSVTMQEHISRHRTKRKINGYIYVTCQHFML